MPEPSAQSEVEVASGPELVPQTLFAECYERARAEAVGLGREQFAAILSEVRKKCLPREASKDEISELYQSLKLEELALARACAAGNERAWETFLLRYREKLYDIAAYIAKESSAARELADSLYADLYGTNFRHGQRISKLASYMGRGSLEGWLRTVMAQEFVNRYRKQKKTVSLDEESESGAQFATPEISPAGASDVRLELATDQALSDLKSEDRFVLSAYFLDQRTLAEVARMLSVHESTISRKLDKLTKSLRKNILKNLRSQGMSSRQAQEALDVDVRDLRLNVRRSLTQEVSRRAFPEGKTEPAASESAGVLE